MVSMAFVSLATIVRADDRYVNSQTQITLTSNNYPGGVPSNWYYPGDAITGTVEGRPIGGLTPPADGLEDIVDVVAADDDGAGGCDPVVFADIRLQANNIAIDPVTGVGTFSFLGSSTQYLKDGHYCAWVAPSDYIEGGSASTYNDNVRFQIHEYRISAQTDRGGYIPGNMVTVFYMVSKIKDGSPMTMTGYTSNWLVQSFPVGETYSYGPITTPTGKFVFNLSNTGDTSPPETYPVYIWFNSTPGAAAERRDMRLLYINVGNLQVDITTPSGTPTYAPGSLLRIYVRVEVEIPGPNPRYPNAGVLIKILDGSTPTSPEIPAYTKQLTSDGSGMVEYAFILNPAVFLDGKTYTVSANGTSILKYDYDTEAFRIQKSLETMSVQLTLDKQSYYSNEDAVLTVAAQPPAGHSQPSTYVYTIYSGSNFFALVSSGSSTYTFHIPRDFTGSMSFRVDVYNVEGDYGWDEHSRSVAFGVMIVNVRPFEYNANDVLTIDFELQSTVMTPSTTSFYYRVSDTSRTVKEGSVNATPNTLRGSFTYTVPNVPDSTYYFYVYASGEGHIISSSDSATLIQQFILTISFDKPSYNPDETMTISYTISPRVSTTPLPRTFYLSYGLLGNPSATLRTTEASGSVTYVVPTGTNEGNILFGMTESSTGTGTYEVVQIGAYERPGTVMGVEIFDWFLLVIIVILFLLMLGMRSRGAGAEVKPKVKEEKAPAPPPPQASPMVVNCKACNAPIEITTSKRPIEVMCPSCGETAMVE